VLASLMHTTATTAARLILHLLLLYDVDDLVWDSKILDL
jgi:hypothetical protein